MTDDRWGLLNVKLDRRKGTLDRTGFKVKNCVI